MLVSAVQQHESALHIQTPSSSWTPPHPKFPSSYLVYTWQCIYVSATLNSSHLPFPTLWGSSFWFDIIRAHRILRCFLEAVAPRASCYRAVPRPHASRHITLTVYIYSTVALFPSCHQPYCFEGRATRYTFSFHMRTSYEVKWTLQDPQSVSGRAVMRHRICWLQDCFWFHCQVINCCGPQLPTRSGVWSLRFWIPQLQSWMLGAVPVDN